MSVSSTFVQISPPSGMTSTSEQSQTAQGSQVTIAITTAVVFGILLWDYFTLLPDEISLYKTSSKERWRSPATWAFVALRYSGVLAAFISLFYTSVQSQNCEAAVVLGQICVVLVVVSSGIIFCYRVFAIWGVNTPAVIYFVLGTTYLAMLGCWCGVGTQYRATNGPRTPFGSNCQMFPIVSWVPISHAASLAFDVAILILFFKPNPDLSASAQVIQLIYGDSFRYILLTTVTNIILLAIQSRDHSWDYTKQAAMPISTLITATMAARVFIHSKLHAAQGLPFTAPAGPSSGDMADRSFMTPDAFAISRLPWSLSYRMSLGTDGSSGRSDPPFASYAESLKRARASELSQQPPSTRNQEEDSK